MWHAGVRINTPDVIKDFRIQFVKFNEGCRSALSEVRAESENVQQWLTHEQIPHLKQELRKCEELVNQARSKYTFAKADSPAYGKSSAIDELKALKKAERRKEEVEKRLAAAKKWATLLDREATKLMAPINNLSNMLDVNVPKGLAKLDYMVRSLEEYLRMSLPDAGIPVNLGNLRNLGDQGHVS
jgi:hypothetical protein